MGCVRKTEGSQVASLSRRRLLLFWFASLLLFCLFASSPGAHDLAAAGSGCFVFPTLVFPCCSNYFRGICSPKRFFFSFCHLCPFRFSSFISFFVFRFITPCIWVHSVRMLCLSYPVIRWHGFALSTLFTAFPCSTTVS